MNKFEDVDIITSLRRIMSANTEHYKSDFETDIDIIKRTASSEEQHDKNLLWLSRKNGTWCFSERDVFKKDTAAHNAWTYYENEKPLAYAVEITGYENGTIYGNLYELNYHKHIEQVNSLSVPVESLSDGSDALNAVLSQQHKAYAKLKPMNITEHIQLLEDKAIRRKLRNMSADEKQSHIDMVELNCDFGSRDVLTKFDMALYNAITKERSKRKPSIRNQLTENTKKSAPSKQTDAKKKEDISI